MISCSILRAGFYWTCEIDIKGSSSPHLFMWQDKEEHFSRIQRIGRGGGERGERGGGVGK